MQLGARGDKAHLDFLPHKVSAAGFGVDHQGVGVLGLGGDGVFAGGQFLVQEGLGAGLPDGVAVDGDVHGDGPANRFVAVDVKARFALRHHKGFEGGVLLRIAHGDGGAAGEDGKCRNEK